MVRTPMTDIINAFTVDVEDYYQVSGFERDIRRDQWDQYESRVVANTERILALLKRHNVKATFFVLGWVADKHPQLVRDIHQAGHEIGSHGYWHRLIFDQSPEEFRTDLRQSRDVLQNIVKRPVTTYRAPSFSITKRSLWALDILAEEGFRIDSSIFPIRHDRYGICNGKRGIHSIPTSCGPLWEAPPSVARIARMNLPISGGGYFRLYPFRMSMHLLARHNARTQHPFMFYVHPWEIDPQQPRLRAGSAISRSRHRINLARNESKLDRLLPAFRFGRLSDVVEGVALGRPHSQNLAGGASRESTDLSQC